jgi:hypothetical protein
MAYGPVRRLSSGNPEADRLPGPSRPPDACDIAVTLEDSSAAERAAQFAVAHAVTSREANSSTS